MQDSFKKIDHHASPLSSRLCCCILMLSTTLFSGCKKEVPDDNTEEISFSFHERNFGESADELLRADRFFSLKVEVQYMDGYEPDALAIQNLRRFLMQRLRKPGGIYFVQRKIPAVKDSVLTRGQVDEIRRANRREYTKGNQLAVYILYTNGEFQNRNILGQAFRNTSIVIYGKALEHHSNTFSNPARTTLETTLLLHEMGHLLGLVDKGTPMTFDHADSTKEAHCNNPKCIMYWGISVTNRYGPLKLSPIPEFDSACLLDLRNNGGK